MQVISKHETKGLIKGKKYTVSRIGNVRGSNSYFIELNGIPSTYQLYHFSTLSGNDIKEEPYATSGNWMTNVNQLREVQPGDMVVCVSKKLKTLTYGKYYTVAKIKTNEHYGTTQEISLEESSKGCNFFYKVWYDNFRIIPKHKQRDINIGQVLEDQNIAEMENYEDPIFADMEKETMVLNLIYKSLEYLYKTKVDATLMEIIEHRLKFEKYITIDDVNKFDLNKVMKY